MSIHTPHGFLDPNETAELQAFIKAYGRDVEINHKSLKAEANVLQAYLDWRKNLVQTEIKTAGVTYFNIKTK